jgi:hypothetical protein
MAGMLLGLWDESTETLTITRPNGQSYKVKGRQMLTGSHKVFGVQTVGDEVHVLTAPRTNRRPSRRVIFSDSGSYKGSKSV